MIPPINVPLIGADGRVSHEWFAFFAKLGNGYIDIKADASAEKNTVYYSTDQSKLVYKSSAGTVNDLY